MKKTLKVLFCEKNNCWLIEDADCTCKDNKYRTMEAAVFDARNISMECGCELLITEKINEVIIKKDYHQ